MHTIAIVHSALFADRSPPRFNRWREVFPEDVWSGLAPHNAASATSFRKCSGLSPSTAISIAAVCGPTPNWFRSHAQLAKHRSGLVFQNRFATDNVRSASAELNCNFGVAAAHQKVPFELHFQRQLDLTLTEVCVWHDQDDLFPILQYPRDPERLCPCQ